MFSRLVNFNTTPWKDGNILFKAILVWSWSLNFDQTNVRQSPTFSLITMYKSFKLLSEISVFICMLTQFFMNVFVIFWWGKLDVLPF